MLIQSLQEGSHTAFIYIFKKYYTILCAYAQRFIELEDSEEIVQEVMLYLWEKRTDIHIESSLRQYLFKMTYNRILNYIVKKKIASNAEAIYYDKTQNLLNDINDYQFEELVRNIGKAIESLPESYRTAFVMHRFQGKSYKEIAEVSHVSPKTIDYRIQQSLKILRIKLKDYLPVNLLFIIRIILS